MRGEHTPAVLAGTDRVCSRPETARAENIRWRWSQAMTASASGRADASRSTFDQNFFNRVVHAG